MNQDREELVQEIIERLLKILPEVIGNLMTAHASNAKLTTEFYSKNLEFKAHKDVVREVVAKIDLDNPTLPYSKVLELARPEIQRQLGLKAHLDNLPSKNSLDLNGLI